MSSSMNKVPTADSRLIAESRHRMISICVGGLLACAVLVILFGMLFIADRQTNELEHQQRMSIIENCRQTGDPAHCADGMTDALDLDKDVD